MQSNDKCHCSRLGRMPTPVTQFMRAQQEDTQPPVAADPRRSVGATWNYTLGSMVFILVAIDAAMAGMAAQAFNTSGNSLDAAVLLLIAISSAVQIRYCWFLKAGLMGGLPATAWSMALLLPAAVAWVVGLFAPSTGSLAALPLWLAISLVACLLPKRGRWMLLAGGIALLVLHWLLSARVVGTLYLPARDIDSRLLLFYAIFVPFVLLSSLWWWGIVVELDRHRRLAGELAVTQERLRFAADLHDIQGHHLQVIALKSELAERMLTINPEAAREHIHETRLIAKEALEETRSLVSGYREVNLSDELQNAREVLTAAGADCTLELDSLPPESEIQRSLAMSVREATTNILRHSNADQAAISLDKTIDGWTLTVRNNGLGPGQESGSAPGNGLTGLQERVAAIGGQLDTNSGSGSFELRVRVPLKEGNK